MRGGKWMISQTGGSSWGTTSEGHTGARCHAVRALGSPRELEVSLTVNSTRA